MIRIQDSLSCFYRNRGMNTVRTITSPRNLKFVPNKSKYFMTTVCEKFKVVFAAALLQPIDQTYTFAHTLESSILRMAVDQ